MEDVTDGLKSALGHRYTVYYQKNNSNELSRLCDQYGSDKGSVMTTGHVYPWDAHTYADYYSRLFGHCRAAVTKVFECGLGTNNPELPSSMTSTGRPGASFRVWRDYFPNADIYGADIDTEILFEEDRIQTFYVDQTNPAAIAALWLNVGCSDFDFILDDGLHTFGAGICFFEYSISKLARTGVYIIEDVDMAVLPEFKQYFTDKPYQVDYVTLFRPESQIQDNNLVVIRHLC